MPGTLYIVATPIGNLEDITLRALRILKEVDLIAAEDTRVTRKLLSRYDIHTLTTPYHQTRAMAKAVELIQRLKAGENLALVSDAGTPGISDPGHELIVMAIEEEIPIVFVPGPNAIIMAVVLSGLSTTNFSFDGFPPRKKGERAAFFRSVAQNQRTLVFYESPSRLVATLQTILAEMGNRRVAILREATKLFEEVFRGSISDALQRFQETEPRGEITLVVEGASTGMKEPDDEVITEMEQQLTELVEGGASTRDAVRQVAIELKLPRNLVYDAAQKMVRSKSTSE